jgi:hypothetical protein
VQRDVTRARIGHCRIHTREREGDNAHNKQVGRIFHTNRAHCVDIPLKVARIHDTVLGLGSTAHICSAASQHGKSVLGLASTAHLLRQSVDGSRGGVGGAGGCSQQMVLLCSGVYPGLHSVQLPTSTLLGQGVTTQPFIELREVPDGQAAQEERQPAQGPWFPAEAE